MILGIVQFALGPILDKIPTGKGKRKAAARYLDGSANELALLMGDIEAAHNSGEVLGGTSLKWLNSRLGTTLSVMRLTVQAIGPDDIVDDE